MNFSETELGIISNALRVAAERFDEHAREETSGLKRQFELQSKDALALYERISNEAGVQN